jgi:polar amino acid transport system substrate-binding protein
MVIGSRHDLHAELTTQGLRSGKNVFVEKPLALNEEELDQVIQAASKSTASLMVGFNRRFSPLAQRAKELFAGSTTPLSILYRVNAGRIPKEHWIQNAYEGGGRIIGEVCHFIDLMQFLCGSKPISVFAEAVSGRSDQVVDADSVLVTLKFANGSNGAVAYLSEGDRAMAKERVEVFGAGRSFVLDDYRRAFIYNDGREEEITLRAQDKGQQQQVRTVCASILKRLPSPIPLSELVATTRTTFAILDSLRTAERVEIPE